MNAQVSEALEKLRVAGAAVRQAESDRRAADHALMQAASRLHDARKAVTAAWDEFADVVGVDRRAGEY